jgi:hypothetical protein
MLMTVNLASSGSSNWLPVDMIVARESLGSLLCRRTDSISITPRDISASGCWWNLDSGAMNCVGERSAAMLSKEYGSNSRDLARQTAYRRSKRCDQLVRDFTGLIKP